MRTRQFFCLGLLIEITVNNRDRIMLLWHSVYEHIANVVQSTVMPCTLVEKAVRVWASPKICQRLLPYKVRNHAILVLQRCLIGAEGIYLPQELWLQWFDTVIFALLDDLLNVGQGSSVKDYRNMEGTFVLAVKLLSKVFLQLLQDDSAQKYLTSLWEGYLNRMESFMKAKFRGKWSENVHEVVPELLKNTLLIMRAKGILSDAAEASKDNSVRQLTWSHVKQIAPSLQTEIFSSQESEQMQRGNEVKTGSMTPSDGAVLVPTTNEIKA